MIESRAALAASTLVLASALAAAATFHVERKVGHHIHALAPQMFAEKQRGGVWQGAAFRQRDLLPLYGGSELAVADRYHASALFREYPTGFTVFPVGSAGSTSLVWLQALAAVGDGVRERKIAVSISPVLFATDGADRHAYAANFSRLHANALAFSSPLSFALKREVARRMLQYPESLAGDALLRFALEQLASDSPWARLWYHASVPLGILQTELLRLADRWDAFVFLRAQAGIAPVQRRTSGLDWNALQSQAEQEARGRAAGNPLWFDNRYWTEHAADLAVQRRMNLGERFRAGFERSPEWTDLELLLRAIGELGGEPLLLSAPINDAYYDYLGIPESVRQIYFARLDQIARRHTALLPDFEAGDAPECFTINPLFHLSGKGWVLYARALDAFFHARPAASM